MAEGTEGTTIPEGQAGQGTGEASPETHAAPEGGGGQPEGRQDGTTGASTAPEDDTFFDPRDIQDKPELMAAYKQMQRAFSKKMENIKAGREKIEAYDAFSRDPITQLQTMAARMGYRLTRAEAQQQLEGHQEQTQGQGKDWQPQTWDEVLDRAEQRAYDRIKRDFEPVLGHVTELRKSNLERFLDDNAPDWRTYEDEMMGALQKHPSLVNDPLSLYRMSIPPDVLESKATQRALKKLEEKGRSAQLSGASTTTRKPEGGIPDRALTFQEAVEAAKKKLAADGIRPQ